MLGLGPFAANNFILPIGNPLFLAEPMSGRCELQNRDIDASEFFGALAQRFLGQK